MRLHQITKFMYSKGKYQQNKRQLTEWENIFADTSDNGLISKFIKNLQNSTPKNPPNNPNKKWAKDLNRQFSKGGTQMTNTHMKRRSCH